jgi:hypothetical protein
MKCMKDSFFKTLLLFNCVPPWPRHRWDDNTKVEFKRILSMWTRVTQLRVRPVADYFEHIKEVTDSIWGERIIDCLSDYQFLYNDAIELVFRATAQTVSRPLLTLIPLVRYQVRSCGICSGQSGLGEAFSEYFGFPCQFSFHWLLYTHLSPGLVQWAQQRGLGQDRMAHRQSLRIGFHKTIATDTCYWTTDIMGRQRKEQSEVDSSVIEFWR